jgi:hypothetical protein
VAEGGAVNLDPVLVMQGAALAGQAFRLGVEAIWRKRDRRDRRGRSARGGRSAWRGRGARSGWGGARRGAYGCREACSACSGRHGERGACWASAGNCPREVLGHRRPGCPEVTPARRSGRQLPAAGQGTFARACEKRQRTSRRGRHRRCY